MTTRTHVSVVNDYADTCQRSPQPRRRHKVNYFTLENEKTKDKSNKKCYLIFLKNVGPRSRLHVLKVVDYIDT